MGTKFAQTYATLVLTYFEESLYQTDREFGEYFGNNIKKIMEAVSCRLFYVFGYA